MVRLTVVRATPKTSISSFSEGTGRPWASSPDAMCSRSHAAIWRCGGKLGPIIDLRRGDGRKELIALADGYRESAESWADLLRDCARRGMRAPVLAVGDGTLGFWGALREVFPQAREGRCWFHKTANVLAALPKSAHPGAKKALAEIWGAEDKAHAQAAVKAFEAAYGAKFPRRPRRSPTMWRSCSRSATTRASTGCTCGPPTPSLSRALPRMSVTSPTSR